MASGFHAVHVGSDRGQPSCGWCARNDQVCEYRERKKPGLRAGYGRDLEQRLDRLEERVSIHDGLFNRYLRAHPNIQVEQHTSHLEDSSYGRPPVDHISHLPASQILEERRTAASPTSFVSASQQRACHPVHSPSQYRGTESGTTQQGTPLPLDTVTRGVDQQISIGGHFWHNPPNWSATTDAQSQLLPHDLLYSLVSMYFEHINAWFPILHRESTFKALFGSPVLFTGECILLHAIVATTMRFCNNPGVTLEARKQIHDSSKERVLLYVLDNSSVRALQAMVILALDLTGSVNGPPAWNLLALITRNTVHLGLAAESTSSMSRPTCPSIYTLRATVLSEPETWIEDEERRRLFWGAYILDRYATISTAFDFGLNARDIERRLPCDNALFEANVPVESSWFCPDGRLSYAECRSENLGSFAFYCELLGIISRIHQFLKQPVDIGSAAEVVQWQKSYRDLDDELTSWRKSLPEDTLEEFLFQSSPSSMNKKVNSCWIMLHATYYTAVMRLHSSAAYPTFRSNFFKPSYSAIQRCIRAAKDIEDISCWVAGTYRLDALGPPFAFSLWVAARVLLVHASTVETTPETGVFVSLLSQMGRRWRVAERYGEILNRVVQEYQQSRLSVGLSERQPTAATVKILADMRR